MLHSIPIYTITNGDETRKKKTIESFHIYGLKPRFIHFPRNLANGKLGCFMSHIEMFKYAHSRNMDFICISEDNIISNGKKIPTEIDDELKQFIKKEPKWNMIILGGFFHPSYLVTSTSYSSIYQTSYVHGTSCYIIHKRLYKRMIRYYSSYKDFHIDWVLSFLSKGHSYIVHPLFFYRNGELPTTNRYFSNTIVNYYYYLFYNKPVQYALEKYSIFYIYIWLCISIVLFFYYHHYYYT